MLKPHSLESLETDGRTQMLDPNALIQDDHDARLHRPLRRHRVRRWIYLVCMMVLVLCVTLPEAAHARPVLVEGTKRPLTQSEQVIRELNRQRMLRGLQPLRVNMRLMTTAQDFSMVQARMGELSHRGIDHTNAGQRLDKAGYNWTFWGETIAGGFKVNEVVAAWLSSPSHRRILLSAKATEVGAGHVTAVRDPAKYYDYWVLNVGRPMPATAKYTN